MEREIEGLQ